MFSNVNNYEMKMPKRYVELSEEEMEYDGGFLNFIVGLAATCVGIVATAAGNAGLIDKGTANTVSLICTGISAVCTLGTAAVVSTALKTTASTMIVRGVVKDTSDVIGYGVASIAGSDSVQYAVSGAYSLASGR
jgi:hypothetical protein